MSGQPVLRIYRVPTGKLVHSWTENAQGLSLLSWTDNDKTLVLPTWSTTKSTVRLLNVTAPGNNLLADSHVVWSVSTDVKELNKVLIMPAQLSADGQTVVYAMLSGPDHRMVRWLAYSVSDKKTRVLYRPTGPDADIMLAYPIWVSPSGDALIVDWTASPETAAEAHIGVVRNGKLTPLPTTMPFSAETLPAPAW
jgi:hypothetical protein